jgi:hypothetical protein
MNKRKRIVPLSVILIITFMLIACGGGGGGGGTGTPPPAAPSNPSASAGYQKATIQWDAVSGSTSYNLYWSHSSGVTKATGTKVANVTSPYEHTHLHGGTYYYVITAVNTAGDGAESVEVSANVNLLVFITSTSGSGDLSEWSDAGGNTGLAAADAICQGRATAANLAGTFKAWLSDTTDDAYCRIHGLTGKRSANCGQATLPVSAGPWIRTDGFPFSDTLAQIQANNRVFAPARYDESGVLVTDYEYYFTNTTNYGILNTGPTVTTACQDWTSSGGSIWSGSTAMTSGGWTEGGLGDCGGPNGLLCMEVGPGPALPSFASAGKIAFITPAWGTGDLSLRSGATGTGLAAADSHCQSLAVASGLTGTFKAWLSDSSIDAADRFTSNGPWVRPDGVTVAATKADLAVGQLFAPINQTPSGTYLLNSHAWTGSFDNGTTTGDNCSDWTDGTAGSNGDFGISTANTWWQNMGFAQSCDNAYMRFYCFED